MDLFHPRTWFSTPHPVLPVLLLALFPPLPSAVSQAAPTSPDLGRQSILPPQALSFETQQEPGLSSWFSKDLTVHGRRSVHPVAPFDKPFMKLYEDGHAEGTLMSWKGIELHMQFGEDTRHDPVTNAFIAPYGEAYRLSNPLKQR